MVEARPWSVLGVGMDVTDVDRISAMIERWGARFLERCFSPEEIHYCQRHKRRFAESYAARWAAKEAAFKALGGRDGTRVWRCYEVGREASGRPTLILHGPAKVAAAELGVRKHHLSLSHDAGLAVALVVLEGQPGE